MYQLERGYFPAPEWVSAWPSVPSGEGLSKSRSRMRENTAASTDAPGRQAKDLAEPEESEGAESTLKTKTLSSP